MNVAIHMNAIGLTVSMASRVGPDQEGEELVSFLKDSGLSTDLIQKDEDLPTSEVLVHLDENNNATYEICEPVAWDNIQPTSALAQRAKDSGLLIYGSLASRNTRTRKTILDLLDFDGLKLMDVNFRKPYDSEDIVESLLKKTNIVKMNEDELAVFAQWLNTADLHEKDQVLWFASRYKIDTVCVSKGEKGALLYTNKIFYTHPGFSVEVADTVGSGDAFLAGLVVSLLDNKKPGDALAFACAVGAFVASKEGATPKYDLEEIQRILNQA